MQNENIIKKLRVKMELTQQELADTIGMSRDAISAYERGVRKPSGFALVALESVFGVPAKMLYDTALDFNSPEPMSEDNRKEGSRLCGNTR